MANKDLVSIIIPVYNTGKYLIRCLQSCLDQTYTNIEVVVVDDHSTDLETLQILKDFQAKDPRVRVIYGEVNQGQGHCRNLGARECKGKYFSYLDSDDYLVPEFVQKMHAGIVKYDTDFVMCDIQKDFTDPSINGDFENLVLDNMESQFNLIHAKNETVLSTKSVLEENCLLIFPVSCCARLYNTERYLKAGVAFSEGPYARHAEDQDWKAVLLLRLNNFLILKFAGYMRVLHLGSVGCPSVRGFLCSCASDTRFYNLIKDHPLCKNYLSFFKTNIFNSFCCALKYTDSFAERLKLLNFFHEQLALIDPDMTLTPYAFDGVSGAKWSELFWQMDLNPLHMMFFSLRPLHDILATDQAYTRELLADLSLNGVNSSVFCAGNSPYKAYFQFIGDVNNALNKHLKTFDSALKNSLSQLVAVNDKGIDYLYANTKSTAPEDYDKQDMNVIFYGVEYLLETSFKQEKNEPEREADEDLAVYALCERVDNNVYPTILAKFIEGKHNLYIDAGFDYLANKIAPRTPFDLYRPQVALVTGGDLVSQQVYRNFKLAGCKVIYFVDSEHALPYQTISGQDTSQIFTAADNVVPQDLDTLIQSLSEKSVAEFKYDEARNDLAFATEYAEMFDNHKRALQEASKSKKNSKKKKKDVKPDLEYEQLLKESALSDMFVLTEDGGVILKPHSPEKIKQMEETIEKTGKVVSDLAEKIQQLRADCVANHKCSSVDPNYLFAPQEFDAVVSYTPELAQRFGQAFNVKVQPLGYVVHPEFNRVQAKTGQMITFPHPVLENGLAIFIKLVHAYTQRHPEAKFMLIQDTYDNFVQDLNKLHDKDGRKLTQLKLNLSGILVNSSKKMDPISACAQTKVLVKLGLNGHVVLSSLPEALINDIPVLATNHPLYAECIQEAGKLLDIPQSTQLDPSCLPSDEEILPYVEALEALMSGDYTERCKKAVEHMGYAKNVEAWIKTLYGVVDKSIEHDHAEDNRKLEHLLCESNQKNQRKLQKA